MDTQSKKTMMEQEAAARFVQYLMQAAREAWPTIESSMKEFYKDKFIVEEEKIAAYNLGLALIAQDLQAVPNLFPPDQAKRLEEWVYDCVDIEDWGEYAKEEVKKYGEKFQHDLNNHENPIYAIPARLLHRWLGKGIQNFDVELNGKKTGILDPLLVEMLGGILISQFSGTWKKVVLQGDVELVAGDRNLKPS